MILFTSAQVGEVLQRLYNSEINIELSSFWDSGFDYKLGDTLNGFSEVPQKILSTSIINTIDAIAFAAVNQYPDSDFAKWYRSKDSNAKQMQSSPVSNDN